MDVKETNDVLYIQDNILNTGSRYEYFLSQATRHYSQLVSTHNFEYRPYQPDMAATYALRATNICAGSCGLGKTIIVGLLASILYTELNQPGQIQIAVPNKLSATTRWMCDLEQIDHLKGKIEFINSESAALKSKSPIWLYTLDFIKRKTKSLSGNRATIDRLLHRRKLTPSLLVVDEVHLLKPGSLRSKHWIWWRKRCKRFLAMSGTLSDGRLDIMGHILMLTYNRLFPYLHLNDFLDDFNANTRVKSNYLKGEEQVQDISPRYLSHIDVTSLAKYSKLARTFIHRVSLNDSKIRPVVTVPTYTENVVKVIPSFEHKAYYNDLIKTLQQDLKTMEQANWRIALGLISPLVSATNVPPTSNQKLKKLIELVDSCDGKSAIFCSQVSTARIIHKELQSRYSANAIRLYATDPECSPKHLSIGKREDLVCRFLYDPEVKVGTFSINLAAESIDLNVAEQIIFYDYPWQTVKLMQAIYRVIRPGSPVKHVNVHYLFNQGMIDQHQYTLLRERKKASNALLDFDPTSMTKSQLSVIDTSELIKRTINTGLDLGSQLDQLTLDGLDDLDLELDDDVPF